MNVEIRVIGKRKKYYLAQSFREGKKTRKVRRYLGADLTKDRLEQLKLRAAVLIKQQIESHKMLRNPLENVLSETEMAVIKNLEKNSPIKILHLSEEEWLLFTEIFTYNTNAIEGSTIRFNEVKDILERELWPKDAPKSEISETHGVAEAIKEIRNNKVHISLDLIKKLHRIVFKNSKEYAGKFRGRGVEVVIRDGLGEIVHVGAPSNKIVSLLKELINWYNKNKIKYSPLVLAVVIHNQFETIHPFQDGNGRVGRLLLNNVLIKHNLQPVNIGIENRREYYESLRQYQDTGNIRPMIELLLKEYKIIQRKLKR